MSRPLLTYRDVVGRQAAAPPVERVPSVPGGMWVYLHLAVDGSVLYVGRSYKPAQRAKQHFHSSSWAAAIARVETLGPFTDSQSRHLERWLIEQLDPPHNYVFTQRWRDEHATSEGRA